MNIANDPFESTEQMVLPRTHIKIGLMEFYAKAMTRKISFAVPSKEFLRMNHVKIKSGIFLGRYKEQHMNDGNFDEDLEGTKKTA